LKTKKIYIIRHGETDYNLRGVVQGSGIDADLNEKGRSQALAFFEKYGHIAFDKIYISNLRRTFQSVKGFIDKGLPYEKHEGLNEISWGKREGKVPNTEDDEYYRHLISSWRDGFTHVKTEEGESPEQVATRQKTVMQHIIANKAENTILICMHGRALRILLTHLSKKPLSEMDMFKHQNLGLYVLSYSYATDQYTVELQNDGSHLNEALVYTFIH
jgi:broad specificity phosphatase PhoE